MILDIENKIIDHVETFYSNQEESAFITSEYADIPEEFPAVMIQQTECSVYEQSQDESLAPHHFRVTFRIDSFSNKGSGLAKSEVKKLMELNDQAMQACKFTLTRSEIMTNFDRTITRGTQIFKAIVGAPKTVGYDQVYQMYR